MLLRLQPGLARRLFAEMEEAAEAIAEFGRAWYSACVISVLRTTLLAQFISCYDIF